LRKSTASSALADEVHEVRETPLLRGKLGLLQADSLRDVGTELPNFLLYTLKQLADLFGR